VVIAAAARWLGTPYAWGGGDLTGPTRGIAHGAGTVGFDCSGLTRYAYAQVGIALPRASAAQYDAPGRRILTMAQLQPGDLVFFARSPLNPATIHHVAIWLGHDAMLEAPQTGDVVSVSTQVSQNNYRVQEFIGGLRPAEPT
jgi:cell wall-associated NlpC family hydrolase